MLSGDGLRVAVFVMSFRVAPLGIAWLPVAVGVVAIIATTLELVSASVAVTIAGREATVATFGAPGGLTARVVVLVATHAELTGRANIDAATGVGSIRARLTAPALAEKRLIAALAVPCTWCCAGVLPRIRVGSCIGIDGRGASGGDKEHKNNEIRLTH